MERCRCQPQRANRQERSGEKETRQQNDHGPEQRLGAHGDLIMAAITLFCQAFLHVEDADNLPVEGAKLTVFQAGTDTPVDVFTDSDLQVAWDQPITTNAAGNSTGPIYLSPTPALKLVLVDADDVPIPGYPMDDYSPAAVAS